MLLTRAVALGSHGAPRSMPLGQKLPIAKDTSAAKRKIVVFTRMESERANARMAARDQSSEITETTEPRKRKKSPSPLGVAQGKGPAQPGIRCLLKATQKKREKARTRQRKFAKKLRASLGGHRLLEMASVKEATRKDYLNKLRGFYDFVSFHALSIQDEAGLDAALCDYGDVLYLDGESCNFGQKLLASLEFVRPEAARAGKLQLPRFKKSLKGWRRLAPTQTRLPMPRHTHPLRQAGDGVVQRGGFLDLRASGGVLAYEGGGLCGLQPRFPVLGLRGRMQICGVSVLPNT